MIADMVKTQKLISQVVLYIFFRHGDQIVKIVHLLRLNLSKQILTQVDYIVRTFFNVGLLEQLREKRCTAFHLAHLQAHVHCFIYDRSDIFIKEFTKKFFFSILLQKEIDMLLNRLFKFAGGPE